MSKDTFIAVDLDGTLHEDDLAFYAMRNILKRNPFMIFAILYWISKGRLYFKFQLAKHYHIQTDKLVYNQELIDYLLERANQGTKIVLASGGAYLPVNMVGEYIEGKFGLKFEKVLSATEELNLLGYAKAFALVDLAKELDCEFEYVGDSPTQDSPVFKHAKVCHFVNPTEELLEKFRSTDSKVFYTKTSELIQLKRWILRNIQTKFKS